MRSKSTFTLGNVLLAWQGRIRCKLFAATLVTVLIASVAASPLLAETHTFKVSRPCSINGTQLERGTYKLKLNDNGEAEIYRGNKKVITAQVELKPRTNNQNRGSILLTADGSISEIRLKKQVVVFVR